MNPNVEYAGHVFVPVELNIVLQVKAINEINLNEEYMDASVVITMNWNDKQLAWKTGKLLESTSYSTNASKSLADQESLKT